MLRDIAGRSKICFLICIVFILTCSACSFEKESNNNIVYPPVRSGNAKMSTWKSYTLSSAFEESDLVAHVRVGNWLEETEMQTFYDATVVSEYKGNTGIKEIVLMQDGGSRMIFKDYPLFTHGNEMLLFLKRSVSTDYDNAYWIAGAFTTIFDVVADSSDNHYLIDRMGLLSESLDNVINYSGELELRKTLMEKLIAKDDIWSSENYYSSFDYIYSLSQIEEVLRDLSK